MADAIDQGCEREQRDRELSMAMRKPEGPAPTGACLWCGEPLIDGMRWCDAGCRDDWEARHHA